MISINIYDVVKKEDGTNNVPEINAFSNSETQYINQFDEKIETALTKNSLSQNGYRNFSIITDKVYKQTVRVKGEVVSNVIIQEIYQAYYKEKNIKANGEGQLITFCKKEDALKVKDILQKEYKVEFEQHVFDLLRIIDEAADVRNAKINVKTQLQ